MSVDRLPAAGRNVPGVWGVLAEFETVQALLAATEQVRDAGFTRFDAHAPIPVHGLDEAMGIRATRLPALVLGGGLAGLVGGLLLQWWTNGVDYPFMISGKPLFGLPAAVPVAFETTILFASIGAVAGLFVANGWPELYHPVFRSERFKRMTTDRFFISIEASDPRFDRAAVRAFLESLGSVHVEELEG